MSVGLVHAALISASARWCGMELCGNSVKQAAHRSLAGFGFLIHRDRTGYVLFAPSHEGQQHVAQSPALGSQGIGIAQRPLLIRCAAAMPAASSRWNLLGILDLVVAISIGTLGAFLATGARGEISTTPLTTLPLLLIPVYFVPLFLMLHIAALLQSRRLKRNLA